MAFNNHKIQLGSDTLTQPAMRFNTAAWHGGGWYLDGTSTWQRFYKRALCYGFAWGGVDPNWDGEFFVVGVPAVNRANDLVNTGYEFGSDFVRFDDTHGYGTVKVHGDAIFPSTAAIRVHHISTLLITNGPRDSYVKITTELENIGSFDLNNLRLWVGIDDDILYGMEVLTKQKVKIGSQRAHYIPVGGRIHNGAVAFNDDHIAFIASYEDNVESIVTLHPNMAHLVHQRLDGPTESIQDGAYGLYFHWNNLQPGHRHRATYFVGVTTPEEQDDVIQAMYHDRFFP